MYCKNCGSILPSNANFCHVCGTKVDLDDIFDAKEEENSKNKSCADLLTKYAGLPKIRSVRKMLEMNGRS